MGDEATYEDWKKAMAKFVRYRMRAMGVSVMSLAAESGLPLGYVKRVVLGLAYPPHKARERLAAVLGASLEHVAPKGGA